jgi:hypothetical protein
MLGALAVAELDDMDIVVGDLAVRGRDTHQLACVPTMMCAMDHDGVVLADDPVDLPALVGEHPPQPEHRLLHALEACGLPWTRAMGDDVRRHHLRERIDVARGEDLLPGPAGDGLEIVAHGRLLAVSAATL